MSPVVPWWQSFFAQAAHTQNKQTDNTHTTNKHIDRQHTHTHTQG